MRNALIISGLLVSLWTYGQTHEIFHSYYYEYKNGKLEIEHQLIAWEFVIPPCGIAPCPSIWKYDTVDYKIMIYPADQPGDTVTYSDSVPIKVYQNQSTTEYFDVFTLEFNYSVKFPYSNLVYDVFAESNAGFHTAYKDTIPKMMEPELLYDTVFVFDTVVQIVYDTIPVLDTIIVIDSVPVYLVYEVSTGVSPPNFEILVTDYQIRLNFMPAKVRIYDISGILLKTSSESTTDISGIKSGVYILKINLQNGKGFETKFMH